MELGQRFGLLSGAWSQSAAMPPSPSAPVPTGPAPAPAMAQDQWTIDLPVSVPTEPPGPVPPPAQPPAPPPPPKVYKPRRGNDLAIRKTFKRLDDNDTEKLSRRELRALKGEKLDAFDRNDDKKVTWREFLMTRLRQLSFKRLDRDGNGKLEGREIEGIVTNTGAKYDRNGDGRVTKKEFTRARREDQAALEQDTERTRKRARKRRNTIMAIADKNRDGVLKGKELGRFRSYDLNENGMISKKEFARAYRRDLKAADDRLALEGKLPKGMAKRLRQDRLGQNETLPVWGVRLDARELARLLGSPYGNVKRNLPYIQKALEQAGIKDRNSLIAALATIRTEVGNFAPIHEYGGPSYWAQYNGRSDLGNRPGTNDGVRYHGRGYIQLTGRANYGTYGRAIGVNLLKNPDKALNPKVAAKVLVRYFQARGIDDLARRGDWAGVRRGVNGGYNGWDTFIGAVKRLKASSGWYDKGWHKK